MEYLVLVVPQIQLLADLLKAFKDVKVLIFSQQLFECSMIATKGDYKVRPEFHEHLWVWILMAKLPILSQFD